MAASARLTDRIGLFLSGGVLEQAAGITTEIFGGLTFTFGETTAGASYQKYAGVNTGLVTLQKSLPVGSGIGYRFQAGQDDSFNNASVDTMVQYQGQYGRYEAAYRRTAGQNSTLLNAAGGVAVIGGDFFFSRPVQDSFALIEVPGVSGVRGYSNNQEVGRSGSTGNLFVPSLLSYYGNKLAIADLDIPLNYTIAGTEKIIAPPYRGGAIVRFPVQRIQRLFGTIELVDGQSTSVPAFGQLTIEANNRIFESPVGTQGQFYFENLPAGQHRALLEHQERHCELQIEVPKLDQDAIKLGELTCRLN
jgi:outer membrane usher protein